MSETLIVLTSKSFDTIKREGGSGDWALAPQRIERRCKYIICCRHAYSGWSEGVEEHGSAFLIGEVSGVIPSPERPDRYIITMRSYALIDVSGYWNGERNPVRFVPTDQALSRLSGKGIDVSNLEWHEWTNEIASAANLLDHPRGAISPLTVQQAKAGLAVYHKVPEDRIEITIRF